MWDMTGVVSKHWNTKKPRQDVGVSFLLSTLKLKWNLALTHFAWSRVNYSHSFPTDIDGIVVKIAQNIFGYLVIISFSE